MHEKLISELVALRNSLDLLLEGLRSDGGSRQSGDIRAREKIIHNLSWGPLTTAMLANRLKAPFSVIEDEIEKMKNEGLVVSCGGRMYRGVFSHRWALSSSDAGKDVGKEDNADTTNHSKGEDTL